MNRLLQTLYDEFLEGLSESISTNKKLEGIWAFQKQAGYLLKLAAEEL